MSKLGSPENERAALELLKSLPFTDLDGGANEDVPDPSDKTLLLVKGLPKEISNLVISSLWEAAFCRGYVYLPIHAHETLDDDYEPDPYAVRPTLMALTKGLHEDYQRRFWSENLFVIGVGAPPDATGTGIQGWLPDEASEYDGQVATAYVKKVYVTFSTRDLGRHYASYLPHDHPSWEPWPNNQKIQWSEKPIEGPFHPGSNTNTSNDLAANKDSLGWGDCDSQSKDQSSFTSLSCSSRINPPRLTSDNHVLTRPTRGLNSERENVNDEAHRRHHELLTTELHIIWINKKWTLAELSLAELTLDFFECYDMDGRWVGDEVATTMAPFQHGLPQFLDIIAPDKASRDLVDRIIRERYQ